MLCHAMTPGPLTSPASDPCHASRQKPPATRLRGRELNEARAWAQVGLALGYSSRQVGRFLAVQGLTATIATGLRVALQLAAEERAARRAKLIEQSGQRFVDTFDQNMAHAATAAPGSAAPSDGPFHQKEAA